MCVLGSVLFLIAIYLYQAVIGFSFWENKVNMGGVANFHTLFNIVVAVVFLPFVNPLIKLSGKIVKDKTEDTKMDKELSRQLGTQVEILGSLNTVQGPKDFILSDYVNACGALIREN